MIYIGIIPYFVFFSVMLIIADGMFLLHFKRKSLFLLRLMLSITVVLVSTYILMHFDNNIFFDTAIFIFLLVLTFALVYFCFETEIIGAFFVALAGYSVQFIASKISYLLYLLSGVYMSPVKISILIAQPLLAVMATFITYLVAYCFLGKYMKAREKLLIEKKSLLFFLFLVVAVEIFHSDYYRIHTNNVVAEQTLLIICAVLVLILQFLTLNVRSLEDELTIIKQIHLKEVEQYRFSKDAMDLINLKYHDMRHQIRAISEQSAISTQVAEELENTIGIYDSIISTGCQPLDVILSEKNLICQKNHIVTTCIADGKELNFLKDTEVYSLFGNLLDNAIKAVLPLPIDNRVIGLSIKRNNSFLVIHSHNYHSGDIRFEDGLPITTEQDVENHGYGTRSILLTAKKYGGTASFESKDNIFHVNILFPLDF